MKLLIFKESDGESFMWAGAVVAKDVPSDSIVIGNTASLK